MEPKGVINVVDEVNYFGDFPKREYQVKNIFIFRQFDPINIRQRKISYQDFPQLYGTYILNLESFDKITGNFVYRFDPNSVSISGSQLVFSNTNNQFVFITGQYKLVNNKPVIIPSDATDYFQLTIAGNKLILKQSVMDVPLQIIFGK
jgi:hypothetical protein